MAEINEDKIYFTKKQQVTINKRNDLNKILDIGGGGESIIEQIYGDQVVAIDINKNELLEAPDNQALKLVMDARNMSFIDEQFDTVISFFTFMYINNDDIDKVFKEVKRVLKSNGRFIIWDLIIPLKSKKDKDYYAARVEVSFENKTVNTGYGYFWENNEQDIKSFIKIAKQNNFKVIEENINQDHFYLELIK